MTRNEIVIISLLTVITMIAWIAFEVHHVSVTSTITTVEQRLIAPLNPKLSPTALEKIRERKP
ncbi:hypothetical protein HY408_00335 [Candidatus Gottesmanbacteria bacterium]|nr:hypothetical protein [Candidatus Gottesmanbacteria bacterium]